MYTGCSGEAIPFGLIPSLIEGYLKLKIRRKYELIFYETIEIKEISNIRTKDNLN